MTRFGTRLRKNYENIVFSGMSKEFEGIGECQASVMAKLANIIIHRIIASAKV